MSVWIDANCGAESVLVLRTCAADLSSQHDFRWPKSGVAEAPDWKPTTACGNGLHGLLWGEGNGQLLSWNADAKWLVVRVLRADVVDLGGKVKFPRGEVVFCGPRDEATKYLLEHGGAGHAIAGALISAGYGGTATAGDGGTATAGDGGTATAGDGGTATAGDGGTIALRWWDHSAQRWRIACADVGDRGIKPKVTYRVEEGRIVEVKVEAPDAAAQT